MPILWGSEDANLWRLARASHAREVSDAAVGKKAELQELDDWMNTRLHSTVVARRPLPHMTKAELCQVMKWKLMKGKWRPRLQSFVEGLSEELVATTTTSAYSFMKAGDFEAALEKLCEMKGIGPATATAILAAYDKSVPFMSDEALEEVLGTRQYTVEEAVRLRADLLKAARRLNSGSTTASPEEKLHAQDLQLALWAAVRAHRRSVPLPPLASSVTDKPTEPMFAPSELPHAPAATTRRPPNKRGAVLAVGGGGAGTVSRVGGLDGEGSKRRR